MNEIPKLLEIHPLGDNGEMEVLPASEKNLLNTSKLPCGLPPILPDTTSMLNSFLENLESLPILHLDAVQRLVPVERDVSALYSMDTSPLQTTLKVKRDPMTGKLLGFTEEIKDVDEGSHKTSTSLSRAPGPPDAGIKGTTSSFPFWPGGMDEPWVDLLKKESFDVDLTDLLDTPPGFKQGMKYERKLPDDVDYVKQPQKINLCDIISMEDPLNFEDFTEPPDEVDHEVEEKVNLEKLAGSFEVDQTWTKIQNLPVLNISEMKEEDIATTYEWAVIEDVKQPVADFHERIPKMAYSWPFELDTFQKKAVLHLEKRESVFVAAHTSAGKTVVAEYAIALAQKNMSRVIYTSPIKALSNQKYRDFKNVFEDVGLVTGDVQINPKAFCLIMTTEILRSMLYHGSDVIRELEWVVFDEVHYINDAERGVVWEEVFIMLPDHVNLIMLSATVPNTAEFAEWLGGIKKRKIYVISTLKRPVPLEYYLYTGSVGKSENDIFPIVDQHGTFLHEKYLQAFNNKKEKESKSKTAKGPKGPRYNVMLAQEKNIYIGLLGYLKKEKLLPAVCFTFSRRRCNEHAILLLSQDLNTQEERSRVTAFFNRSISKLNIEDRDLPQIKHMEEQLKRGFGVHHSGILPILKEIIEMLFQEGLVKVLFATETFAMGVNMPAKTVVFDSMRKHDGLQFRDLLPSEFIQMAGRAGRRGQDDIGTVIVLCKAEVPDSSVLQGIMKGKPTKLESQFKLTYTMILNLLKVRTFRVEDVMKRSFGESNNQKQRKRYQAMLTEATQTLSTLEKPECSLCSTDLLQYILNLRAIRILKKEVMQKKCLLAIANKLLLPGRIIIISTETHQNVPGILLNVSKENKCKVLAIHSKNKPELPSAQEMRPWSSRLFFPNDKQPSVFVVMFEDIQVIGTKTLKIDPDAILKEWRKMELMSGYMGHHISSAFQDLCSLCESNLNKFPSANVSFKELEFVEKVQKLEALENTMERFTCVQCVQFSKHFSELSKCVALQEDIKNYKFKISEESLALHPEYESRKLVLKQLRYIDSEENVQLKGSVAREMSNHELLITELLMKSVLNDCSPQEIAALLSCMVFQQKMEDEHLSELPSNLRRKVDEIRQVACEISLHQSDCGINDPDFVAQYNFGLVNVVYEWAEKKLFAEIMLKTDVDEGIIVRTIQRLIELLKDVRNGASLVGDTVLAKKMDDASAAIKRGIVFAASLYTS